MGFGFLATVVVAVCLLDSVVSGAQRTVKKESKGSSVEESSVSSSKNLFYTEELLPEADIAAVFCGGDAELSTCKYFTHALRKSLAGKLSVIGPRYAPEVLMQSFYVPPMLLPFTGVTLRLIERDDRRGVAWLYASGFCFDSRSSNKARLPEWRVAESRSDTGPLDSERAAAAGKLAKAVADFIAKNHKKTEN